MSDRLHVATRKGLFTFTRAGREAAWRIDRTAFLGDPVSNVLEDPRDGSLYAALHLGHFGAKLQRSDDGGATWEELAVPVFPKVVLSAGEVGADGTDSDAAAAATSGRTGASLQQIWTLEAGGDEQPGVLLAGCIPAGVFRSPDRGEHWELVTSLWERPERAQWFGGGTDEPGVHTILRDPRGSERVHVGISCGGVWHTADAGETWELRASGLRAAYMPPERAHDPNIQDPHRIARCTAHPDVLWCQHHNGVFRSTDDGRTWNEITTCTPSNFGFGVAAHPEDPDTAWLVPGVKDECRIPVDGRLLVSRTRDGGHTWEALTRGLPEGPAYDIVYRHALDIDASGDQLAMGSTTGSLWWTGDQGETWQALSRHLPPVYAVRFAP